MGPKSCFCHENSKNFFFLFVVGYSFVAIKIEKREKFIDKLEINKLETNYERKSEKQKKYGKKEEPYFNEVHFNKTKLG